MVKEPMPEVLPATHLLPAVAPGEGTDDLPAWTREPAKIVGWIVSGLAFVVAVLAIVLSPDIAGVLPDDWVEYLRGISATLVVAGLFFSRLQALLTRNGIGPTGNGIDGVWSPASVAKELTATAVEVARQKAVDPGTHAR